MPRRPQRRLPLSERIKDGRIYRKSGTSSTGVIYLRCQKTTICQGTAKIVHGEIEVLNAHSEYCRPDDVAETVAQFRESLKDALQHHWYKLRDLYDTHAAIYPEAAARIPYPMIRSYMKKCRRAMYPPTPRDIEQFVERLNDPPFQRNLEYNAGRITVRLIVDDSGHKHALFYDENFVNNEMRDVTRLFIDGTFKSTPSLVHAYQLVTIIGIKFNHGIPFIWTVMSRKTQIAYSAVLNYIRNNLIPENNIILAMSDFERALRNAVVDAFPRAHSTGCNTHHDRALYQKAKSIGLANLLKQNAEARIFVKKVSALAYLPANLISGEFNRIKNNLPENLKRRFSRFVQYYKTYWIGTVKPAGFSVYGLSRRTNNISESYNSRLGHKLETHPSPWDFVCKLLKLQSDARADVQRLRNNCQISRHARYATIFKQRELTKAWRELHMQQITIDEFMQKAASLKGNVDALIEQQTNGREGGDFELERAPALLPLANDPDYDREIFDANPPHWLRDNAEVVPPNVEDEPNDISDNEPMFDISSSESSYADELHNQEFDENYGEEIRPPNVDEDEIPTTPEHNSVGGGNNSPGQISIQIDDEFINPMNVENLPSTPNSPPAFIVEEMRPINIRGIISPGQILLQNDGEFINPMNVVNLPPTPNSPPATIGQHQNISLIEPQHAVTPANTESALRRKRMKNKRRLEMRNRAKARRALEAGELSTSRQAALEAELLLKEAALAEARSEIQRQAESAELERAEAERLQQEAIDNDPRVHTMKNCSPMKISPQET